MSEAPYGPTAPYQLEPRGRGNAPLMVIAQKAEHKHAHGDYHEMSQPKFFYDNGAALLHASSRAPGDRGGSDSRPAPETTPQGPGPMAPRPVVPFRHGPPGLESPRKGRGLTAPWPHYPSSLYQSGSTGRKPTDFVQGPGGSPRNRLGPSAMLDGEATLAYHGAPPRGALPLRQGHWYRL